MKVVFFGSSKFVIPIIEVLKDNFELSLVITTEHDPNSPIVSYCKNHKLHYYIVIEYGKQKNEILEITQGTKATLGMLAFFGVIVPNKVLNIFTKGIINIHPSLLPKYRGPTPIQTAILNGETKTGVTIIKLDEQVDHGPILAQKEVEILQNDTTGSLHARLFKLGSEMLTEVINEYLTGKLKPKEQNHKKATFTKSLARQDGFIDINNPPSKEKLDRMIRAFHPWPGVYSKLKIKNEKLKIVKFLPEKRIQVEGKKPMSYKDFINGYPEAKQWLEKLLGEKT